MIDSEENKMSRLWVVNTTLDGNFLDEDFQINHKERAQHDHQEFISKVREVLPGFQGPYLALFTDGGYQIPIDLVRHNVRGEISENDKITFDDRIWQPLDEHIDGLVTGAIKIPGVYAPIDTIVEFSAEELYPAVMEKVAQKHNIFRAVVE